MLPPLEQAKETCKQWVTDMMKRNDETCNEIIRDEMDRINEYIHTVRMPVLSRKIKKQEEKLEKQHS